MAIELDEIDVALLTQLQQDADRTNLELAALVGLSPAATLHRVRRLKESGVIRIISAQLEPGSVGFPLSVYVAVTTYGVRATQRFEQQVRELPQIVAADVVAGEMDYWLTVVARDIHDLEHVLTRLATHGGQRVITYLRLKQLKPPSPLPIRASAGRAARAHQAGQAGQVAQAGQAGQAGARRPAGVRQPGRRPPA